MEEVDRLNWRIDELSQLEDELNAARSELFDAASESNNLKKKLEAASQELEQVKQELNQVKEELSGVTELNNRLLGDNSALAKQVEELHDQISMLSEERLKWEALSRNRQQVDEDSSPKEAGMPDEQMREEIKILTDQLSRSAEANQQLEAKCQTLLTELKTLQQERDEIRSAAREFERPRGNANSEQRNNEAVTVKELDHLRVQYEKMKCYCQELEVQVCCGFLMWLLILCSTCYYTVHVCVCVCVCVC